MYDLKINLQKPSFCVVNGNEEMEAYCIPQIERAAS